MQNDSSPSPLGTYIRSLGTLESLDADAERELALRWAEGDERAGERLISSCLPFVIRVAKEYRHWGIPMEDLVQQGNLGLIRAAKKFDPAKDCRLITYAVYWIRAEIRSYVVQGYRSVRLGTTASERRAMRTFRRSEVEGPEELAERSGMPLARARMLWPLLLAGDVSLDASRDGGPTLGERLAEDTEHGSPEERAIREDTAARVREGLAQALQRLTKRERRIIEERLLAEDPVTLRELGRRMGLSRERVRQLEVSGREKLRSSFMELGAQA